MCRTLGLGATLGAGLAAETDTASDAYWLDRDTLPGLSCTRHPDGTYRPTVTVTRDAMAVFIARGFTVPQ